VPGTALQLLLQKPTRLRRRAHLFGDGEHVLSADPWPACEVLEMLRRDSRRDGERHRQAQ
jgi:hypothetical protein